MASRVGMSRVARDRALEIEALRAILECLRVAQPDPPPLPAASTLSAPDASRAATAWAALARLARHDDHDRGAPAERVLVHEALVFGEADRPRVLELRSQTSPVSDPPG